MVTSSSINNSPLVSRIGLATVLEKRIVLPPPKTALICIAWRNEPLPSSAFVFTTMSIAKEGTAKGNTRAKRICVGRGRICLRVFIFPQNHCYHDSVRKESTRAAARLHPTTRRQLSDVRDRRRAAGN